MDFDLTGDQKLIQESIREFLQKECPYERVKELEENERGYDPDLWRKMAGLGYLGIAFPEEYGGTGGSFIELMIVAEELGKAACPSPFFSTIIQCSLLILEAGAEAQKRDLLRGIASGDLILALAQYEEDGSYLPYSVNLRAERDGRRLVLNGTKMFVKDANIADKFIVVATGPESGVSLCLAGAREPGIAISKMPTIGMDNTCEVVFKNVRIDMDDIVGQVGKGGEPIEKTTIKATLVKCAEMIGGCKACIDMTAAYAKQRKQYGAPIGSFQIIQHYMADMLLAYDTSYNYLYKVGWMTEQGMDCADETSALKACINKNYKFIAAKAVQIHGAIGTTREGNVGLYYRRAKSMEYEMGDTSFHYEKIAHALLG
jgi:alkylation response protein AidB-like acyl-CoA dehydrogenase